MVDHSSRNIMDDISYLPIRDSFLHEHTIEVKVRSTPWYVHIVNYLVASKIFVE